MRQQEIFQTIRFTLEVSSSILQPFAKHSSLRTGEGVIFLSPHPFLTPVSLPLADVD